MNLVKKILLVHPTSATRRKITMLLAAVGFDVRVFSSAEQAVEGAQGEWFDLALLDHDLPDALEFNSADRLRKVQPTLPVILLVSRLEFPVVVHGIRQGVSDVLQLNGDFKQVVVRVCAFFNVVPSTDTEVSSDELRQAEKILDCLGGVGGGSQSRSPFPSPGQDQSAALLEAARERALMERQLERLGHERNAIEAQLKTLLAQNSDIVRLQVDAAELRSQREIVAAAQAAIDEKARQLSQQRAELNRERGLLDEERRQLEKSSPVSKHVTPEEQTRLSHWERQLNNKAELLRDEATRLQQDRAQLATERRSWHRDLDTLRDQEDNLRCYENRLRELQARLETERVSLLGVQAQPMTPRHPYEDRDLQEAWSKLQRATELFEAEKAHLREDRLAVRESEKALKLKEFSLSSRESPPRRNGAPSA